MADLAVLAVLAVVGLGAGRRLLRAVPFASLLEEALFALALAVGLLAYATLALAEARLLYRPVLAAFLAAAAWYGRREVLAGLAVAARGLGRWRRGALSVSEGAALVVAAIVIGAELIMVLAPPVGGDQTKYQLVYPRLYAEAHRIVDTPWSFWGYFQYLVNMLFAAAFVLRGDVLARLVNAAFGVLTALALFTAGRRLFGRPVGVWAALLFATMPLTATLMIRAWVEFALTFYVVLAVLAMLTWREGGARGWLVLGAVMAGFAAGTKLIGLLVPALLGGLVLVHARCRGAAFARALVTTVKFGLVAAVVASPCYLRNAVATGNPIFPFGYAVFDGRNWSPEAARGLDAYYAAYRESQAAKRGAHAYRSWWEALRFPWDATMAPHSFEESGRSAFDIGPFLLAFAPGVLLLGRTPRASVVAALAGTYSATVVLGMWAHPRYVHPALALLLLVAVAVAERCRAYGPLASRAVTVLLVVTVLGQAALAARVMAPLFPDSLRVAIGRMSADAFLRRHEPRYPLASLVQAAVPDDGNVLVLGMIPHPYYYVGRRFTLASPLEQGAIDYRRIETVDEFVAVVQRFGVTHVVREVDPNKRAVNPVGERVPRLWDGLLARCEKLGETAAGTLYRLRPAAAAMAAEGAV